MAHTSDYRSGSGEMVEDQQVEGGSYVGGAYRNGEGRGAACGGGAHRGDPALISPTIGVNTQRIPATSYADDDPDFKILRRIIALL